jgi:predicted transcriptional regulator of viral defense system
MHHNIRQTTDYLQVIRGNGRYSFTLDELTENVPKTLRNIRKDIDRLRSKGEIIYIVRGFYTVLPDDYKIMGMMPVEFYIDNLMNFMKKEYSVGLYSAAMLHRAGHQQPQEFFVVARSPKSRKVTANDLIIHFHEKRRFPFARIEQMKSETGYFSVSSRELTFLDLIYFEKAIGGLDRIITILIELAEEIKINSMKCVLKNSFPLSTVQRAGYLAEHFGMDKLHPAFEIHLAKRQLRPVLLDPFGDKSGELDEKWRIIVNTDLEADIDL